MFRRVLLLAALLPACGGKPSAPPPAHDRAADASTPAAQPETDAAAAKPAPPPLSPEDIALIEADPKTLSPEQRKARAYALRRKIMQNPDSPQARMLEDLAEAAKRGEIDSHGNKGPMLSTPGGGPPPNARPPAGVRPEDMPPKDQPPAAEPPSGEPQ